MCMRKLLLQRGRVACVKKHGRVCHDPFKPLITAWREKTPNSGRIPGSHQTIDINPDVRKHRGTRRLVRANPDTLVLRQCRELGGSVGTCGGKVIPKVGLEPGDQIEHLPVHQ